MTRRIPGSVLSLSALRNAQGRGPFNSDAAGAGCDTPLICNCRGAVRLAAAAAAPRGKWVAACATAATDGATSLPRITHDATYNNFDIF